jgi:hypothetical protein
VTPSLSSCSLTSLQRKRKRKQTEHCSNKFKTGWKLTQAF